MNRLVWVLSFVAVVGILSCAKNNQSNSNDSSLSAYIVQRVGVSSFGGKVFCSFETFGEHREGQKLTKYIWVLCQEYYKSGSQLKKGVEKSGPVVLEFVKMGNDYKVVKLSVLDNAQGSLNLPTEFSSRMVTSQTGAQEVFAVEKLEAAVLANAKNYYGGK